MNEDEFRSQDTRGMKALPDANTIREKITAVTSTAADPGNAHTGQEALERRLRRGHTAHPVRLLQDPARRVRVRRVIRITR